jgi:DNA polymerase-3 subunit gamma/tau
VADLDIPATASGADPSVFPYQSLYRRYRPQRFDEVRGQEHVTRALRNAVRDAKVAHAYLFSGPRGTGKTSTARILAMALNCANPLDGEPDGTCNSCVEIRKGSSLDVQELDAASNRKLDEMRDLLSRVALGTRGRWKVYIVDEVHQLTPDAASALLKTLEEPPAHVVFVLATTDPQKVLPTIRSRTQHFEFRLLSAEVLGQLLRDVNGMAALGVAPEAIDLVVRRGHGSARDALSVLDQVAAAGEVESEAEVVSDITEALADGDAGRVILAVAEGISAGRDPRRLAADLLDHLRNGFLTLQARQLVLLPDDAAAEVEAQAHRLGLPGVVRAMEVIGQALVDMRDSVDSRITFEVALVRLSHPRIDTSVAALAERIEELERRVRELGHSPAVLSDLLEQTPSVTQPVAAASRSPETERAAPVRSFPRPAARSDATAPPPGQGPVASGLATGDGEERALTTPPSRPPGPRSALGAHRKGPAQVPPSPGVGGPPPPRAPSDDRPDSPSGRSSSPSSPSSGGSEGAPPRRVLPPPPARSPVSPPPTLPTRPSNRSAERPAPTAPASPSGSPSTPKAAAGAPARSADNGGSGTAGVRTSSVAAGAVAADRSPTPVGGPGPAAVPAVGGLNAVPMPSRDDITDAWADSVLPKLRVPARAFLVSGRFQSVEEGVAVFAVPDRPLLDRAASVKGEAEVALSAHFGRSIALRLVHDREAAPPPQAPGDEPGPDDPSDYDLDDLADAPAAVVSPEERLLRAFPGAKEVEP